MIALLLPSNIEDAPYLQYYIDVLKQHTIPYIVIYWNRKGTPVCKQQTGDQYISLDIHCEATASPIKKLSSYLLFSWKAKTIIRQQHASMILCFTIPLGILLCNYLCKNFKHKYILDIRDYNAIVARKHNKFIALINNARLTVISSEGFKNWLPQGEYLLSHNIRKKLFDTHYDAVTLPHTGHTILTIGQIRDYNTNRIIAQQIANHPNINGLYGGFGLAYNLLESEFASYNNMSFLGRYNKADESKLVLQCDFINAITPADAIGRDLTSNRFYLAILYKRPILVMAGTYQAQLVQKYQLGIVVNKLSELYDQIETYTKTYNPTIFSENCDRAKTEIFSDIHIFEEKIANTIEH